MPALQPSYQLIKTFVSVINVFFMNISLRLPRAAILSGRE